MENLSYLEIFRQRWLAIVIAVLLGVGSAALFAFTLQPSYTATATLFLSIKDTNATLAERSQFALARVNSYADLVQSSDVLQPVIDQLGLKQTVQQLAPRVSASNPNSTVNIKISASASSGESASSIANAVGDSLSRLVSSVEDFGTFSVSLDRVVSAFPPAAPSAPQKNVILGLGLITGLAVGAIAALLLARFDRRIRTVADVRRSSGLPVFGTIPRRRRSGRKDDVDLVAEAAVADAILRIRQANGGGVPHMLLLIPAGRHSAPARVRLTFAAAMAATGREVLLLDTEQTADQSSPLSEFAHDEGLAELLEQTTTLPMVLKSIESIRCRVLPVGVSMPSELQAEHSFRPVMTEILNSAEVVISQATPSTRPASIPLIAPFADVSIIVVHHNSSTDSDLAQAISQLRIVGVRPIGVVLVDVPRARFIDLSSTWTPEDFAQKPARAIISPRRTVSSATGGRRKSSVRAKKTGPAVRPGRTRLVVAPEKPLSDEPDNVLDVFGDADLEAVSSTTDAQVVTD